MGDDVEEILQQIIELAYLLNFSTAAVQSKDGHLIGMYIGEDGWVKGKTGNATTVPH